VTLHDFIPQKTPHAFGGASAWYFTRLIPYLQRRADAFIANSDATKREAVEVLRVAPEKITVVPMFASPSLIQAASVAGVERDPSVAGRYFLFVGTLEERKNPAAVIMAYSRLPKDVRAEVGLRMVGRRTGHAVDLTALAYRLGIADRVRFLDYVTDVELAREYTHSLALVLLSRHEGFGIPALEAMTLGVPAVLSDIPAFKEYFAEASIQVPPDDEKAASDAMMKVYSDVEARVGLINRGKRLASKFGAERTARETMEVYRKVV
jgi:alpha-1,3-rhamnosyl/mannosyltransferase